MDGGLAMMLNAMGIDVKGLETTLKVVGERIPQQLSVYDQKLQAMEEKLDAILKLLESR